MPKKKTVFTPNKYKKCLDDAHSSPDNNSEISSLDNPVKDLDFIGWKQSSSSDDEPLAASLANIHVSDEDEVERDDKDEDEGPDERHEPPQWFNTLSNSKTSIYWPKWIASTHL